MIDNTLNLEKITHALNKHVPKIGAVNDRGHAGVAMLLREGEQGPEVLFIIRAEHDRDPWSGNIGFPGGRLNRHSETPKEAAERETYEEIGFDLDNSMYLGRLDDLYGAIMPVLVSCFVYRVDNDPIFTFNYEIAASFWCQLPTLLEKQRHRNKTFYYRNEKCTHPVVELLDGNRPVLWGITYRLIRNFFSICELDFGHQEKNDIKP